MFECQEERRVADTLPDDGLMVAKEATSRIAA